jgi:hypothetical protein
MQSLQLTRSPVKIIEDFAEIECMGVALGLWIEKSLHDDIGTRLVPQIAIIALASGTKITAGFPGLWLPSSGP